MIVQLIAAKFLKKLEYRTILKNVLLFFQMQNQISDSER